MVSVFVSHQVERRQEVFEVTHLDGRLSGLHLQPLVAVWETPA
jgi:hypothetical protein